MKNLIKNILMFVLYLAFDYIIIGLFYIYGIDYQKLPLTTKIITLLVANIMFIIILSYIYRNEIKIDFSDFKENKRKYLSKNLPIYVLGVLLMGFSNVIIQRITNVSIGGNEEAVRSLIKSAPLFMAFSSVIYAPFVEEMVFRKIVKNVIKNKYKFIIISGFTFGILHISDFKSIEQILLGIPYIIMGIDFAYIYYKTNNIFTTMTFHLCHNLILLIIQLL